MFPTELACLFVCLYCCCACSLSRGIIRQFALVFNRLHGLVLSTEFQLRIRLYFGTISRAFCTSVVMNRSSIYYHITKFPSWNHTLLPTHMTPTRKESKQFFTIIHLMCELSLSPKECHLHDLARAALIDAAAVTALRAGVGAGGLEGLHRVHF